MPEICILSYFVCLITASQKLICAQQGYNADKFMQHVSICARKWSSSRYLVFVVSQGLILLHPVEVETRSYELYAWVAPFKFHSSQFFAVSQYVHYFACLLFLEHGPTTVSGDVPSFNTSPTTGVDPTSVRTSVTTPPLKFYDWFRSRYLLWLVLIRTRAFLCINVFLHFNC